MPEWRAGAAEWEITPPLGIAMTGYAGRPGPADHRLDRLFVRALALQPETGDPVVLVGLDLLGIEPETVAAIRSGLTKWAAPERLVLNCSHTHAGPTTARLRCMGSLDAAYQDLIVRWTVSVVREALRDLRPATLRFGTSTTGIGQNRRELRDGRIVLGSNPHGAYDPTVSVLRVESPDGSPIACWFSHACHPTILGPRNTGLSAEWPGVAAGVLKQALGCPAIFAQGCCGDINPIHKSDYAAVRTLGRQLAGAALVAWERAELLTGAGTDAALETVQLPLQVPSAAEAREALTGMEERRAQVDRDLAAGTLTADEARVRREIAEPLVEWGHDYLHAAESGESRTQAMDVQAVRIGDLGIVATAAETFVEIGLEIQRRSPLARTVSLGYTNGCYGYLPTEKAFPLGGYEVDAAYRYYGTLMVTPECERLTLETADRVMGRAFFDTEGHGLDGFTLHDQTSTQKDAEDTEFHRDAIGMKMAERPLEMIAAEVERLARIIDVPLEWLPTFGTSRGDGHPFVEFDHLGFHYASAERDNEFFRRLLFTEDDLLYAVFCDLTFQMAYSSPEAASRSGSDRMAWIFARQRDLLAWLNLAWANRVTAER